MKKPDQNTLNSWLNGELEGAELHAVDAWAEEHAGELDAEFKCSIGWDALCDNHLQSLPAFEEPPYPEFFNSKIMQAIQHQQESPEAAPDNVIAAPDLWQKLRWALMPAAAAALVAFYIGSAMSPTAADPSARGLATSVLENVYVPSAGVAAAVSESDVGTEIVLEGLSPISDEIDIAAAESTSAKAPYMMANSEGENVDFY